MREELAVRLRALATGGRVTQVLVAHDDDCLAAASDSLDDCTCDPDLHWRLVPRA